MNKLKLYTVIGIVFVSIIGSLAHFVYGWSGENPVAALFFPINESTWEHMKLLFFPMLLYSVFMSSKLKASTPCSTSALLAGILFGTFLIPVFFYTYTGILGMNTLVLDIAVFILSVIFAFCLVYKLTLSCKAAKYNSLLKFLVFLMTLAFWVFTYFPPNIALFYNPVP